MTRFRARTFTAYETTPLEPIVRLWILRLLVLLNVQQAAIREGGFSDSNLPRLLGLEVGGDGDDSEFDVRLARRSLVKMHRAAERNARKTPVPEPLEGNLGRLAELLGMSEAECQILAFAVILHGERTLDDLAEFLGMLPTVKVYHVLSIVLDLPPAVVRAALDGQGVLARSGLLQVSRCCTTTLRCKLDLVSEHFADNLSASATDPISLLRDVVLPSTPGHLTLSDFEHLDPSLDLLRPYLRKALESARQGVNILVHGSPGTGKNQLVKALAAEMGCGLYEVSSEDSDGDPVGGSQRLRAYRAAQSVLARTRSIILFDEVQDVFDCAERAAGFGGSAASGRKAWINRALESNAVPSLWLTNSLHDVDPAFIRRFDMVLETPIPPRRQREKIVIDACGDLLSAGERVSLVGCESLAPAVVARAASVARFVGDDLGSTSTGAAIQRLINQTLQAQGHAGLSRSLSTDLPGTYDPAFISADADLVAVARGLAATGSGRLCLYGPPGTGKTAWARWLAREMERPVLVRRASDLISKWLGESERNIAAAFAWAEADGAILLIDEVDSFLQERRGAEKSWEVTQVNEMLTQMESFSGLFIASTNLMDGLDAASLRRFDLKVRFDYLRPDQAWALLDRYLVDFGLPPAEGDLRARLSRLDRLTPGDFAALGRQHRFRPMASAADLISALENEVSLKRQGAAHPIGFV